MSEEAIVGVVSPQAVSYLEQDREGRPFEDAHSNAVQALSRTRDRLTELRKQRGEINAEIKTLVDDEVLLNQMVQVRKSRQD